MSRFLINVAKIMLLIAQASLVTGGTIGPMIIGGKAWSIDKIFKIFKIHRFPSVMRHCGSGADVHRRKPLLGASEAAPSDAHEYRLKQRPCVPLRMTDSI
jgi:hypothetical protein